MTKNSNISKLIKDINNRLEDYMAIHNIHPPKGAINFKCPNTAAHKHGDNNPSASLMNSSTTGAKTWYCHTCGAGTDTIAMAKYIEGLPTSGSEFITTTIKRLAEELGLKFNPEQDLTEEEKRVLAQKRANEETAKFLVQNRNEAYLKTRNTSKETSNELYIGTCDIDKLNNYLIHEKKISKDILESVGLLGEANKDNPDKYNGKLARAMFNKDRLVFPVRDLNGDFIGFVSRNMNWKKGSNLLKYLNTKNNNLFTKSNVLFPVYSAATTIKKKGYVYIVEGTTDAVSLYKNGIKNVVAILGTNFTTKHINMLDKLNVAKLIFTLDGDEAGKLKTLKTINQLLETKAKQSIYIKIIPENMDPDEYMNKYGADKFLDLPEENFIEYMGNIYLEQDKDQEENIVDYLEWMVKNVDSPLSQNKYIKLLAKKTGIELDLLQKQLKYIVQMKDNNVVSKVNDLFNNLKYKWAKVSLRERIQLLDDAREKMTILTWDTESDVSGKAVKELTEMNNIILNSDSNKLVTGFSLLDQNVPIPKIGSNIVFGAYPNIGKSNITRNLAYNIATMNNDVSVLYCTLDDSNMKTIPSFIGLIKNAVINEIKYPQSITNPTKKREVLDTLNTGFRELRELATTNKLIILDQESIPTTSALENYVTLLKRKLDKQNRSLVVFVDSIHSFMDVKELSDPRLSIINVMSQLKKLKNVYDLTIFMNGELNKTGREKQKRPTLANLSESARIEYLVDIGSIIHSDMFYNGDAAKIVWVKNGIRYPILEINVEKNKEGYYKGDIWYKLDPNVGRIYEVTEAEKRQILKSINETNAKKHISGSKF